MKFSNNHGLKPPPAGPGAAQEGKAGAGHAKAGIGEKLSKNVDETKEKLHIGNKHGEATAAKEHHKHNEKEHMSAAASHADNVGISS